MGEQESASFLPVCYWQNCLRKARTIKLAGTLHIASGHNLQPDITSPKLMNAVWLQRDLIETK